MYNGTLTNFRWFWWWLCKWEVCSSEITSQYHKKWAHKEVTLIKRQRRFENVPLCPDTAVWPYIRSFYTPCLRTKVGHLFLQPWAQAMRILPAVPRSTQPSTIRRTVNEYQLLGWVIIVMATVAAVDDSSLQADSQPKSGGLSEGRWQLGANLHSPDEPSELSQWPRSWWQHLISLWLLLLLLNNTQTDKLYK